MQPRFIPTAQAPFQARRMFPRRAGPIANAARIGFGLFYIGTALYNTFVMFPHLELYEKMVEPAIVPLYKTFTTRIIAPYAPVWTFLLILGELSLAVLLLSKKLWVKIGLVGGILWCLILIPGLGLYGLANIPLILAQALLLRREYDKNVLELLHLSGRSGSRQQHR